MHKKQISTLSDSILSNYLSYVSKVKLLTEKNEYDLAIKWKEHNDEEAAKKLMIAHLPLVIKVAYEYKSYGQPIIDLISEGNIGLMKAIYKFDPYKGFRLATYAIWWIKAYITDYILNSYSLVKSGSIAGRKKLFFSLKRLKQKLGILTSQVSEDQAEQISKTLSISKEDVKYVNNMIENKDLSLEVSIYNSNGELNSTTYGDLLPDNRCNPEEYVLDKEIRTYSKNITSEAMQVLNPRERFIIEQRFLIEKPRSLSNIAIELNLSRERVRQIEYNALKKAKKYITSK